MAQRKYLSREEIELLLSEASRNSWPERNYCLILMGFLHGFRISELLGLRLSDIDMRAKVIYVRRIKNGFSTQQPLLPRELRALKTWLNYRATLFHVDESNDWVFVSRAGNPLTRQAINKLLRQLSERAMLPVMVHPHMLRHACGYALADQGLDTRLIQDYLGHRNIKHTVLYTASNSARFKKVWQNS